MVIILTLPLAVPFTHKYITEVVQQSKARKKADFLAAFAPVGHTLGNP
jgi:hypothetical protein